MKLVIIESPYAGDIKRNVAYAKACMRDCLQRGEAPYASHLLLPQVLDDADLAQRRLGIAAGLAWGEAAALTAVYTDEGISAGMRQGIFAARRARRPIAYRSITSWGVPSSDDIEAAMRAALADYYGARL